MKIVLVNMFRVWCTGTHQLRRNKPDGKSCILEDQVTLSISFKQYDNRQSEISPKIATDKFGLAMCTGKNNLFTTLYGVIPA